MYYIWPEICSRMEDGWSPEKFGLQISVGHPGLLILAKYRTPDNCRTIYNKIVLNSDSPLSGHCSPVRPYLSHRTPDNVYFSEDAARDRPLLIFPKKMLLKKATSKISNEVPKNKLNTNFALNIKVKVIFLLKPKSAISLLWELLHLYYFYWKNLQVSAVTL